MRCDAELHIVQGLSGAAEPEAGTVGRAPSS